MIDHIDESERLDEVIRAALPATLSSNGLNLSDLAALARDLDARMANRFVSMYVNDRTLDYGPDGREAIRKLLELGHERGIIPIAPQVDFVD